MFIRTFVHINFFFYEDIPTFVRVKFVSFGHSFMSNFINEYICTFICAIFFRYNDIRMFVCGEIFTNVTLCPILVFYGPPFGYDLSRYLEDMCWVRIFDFFLQSVTCETL